MTRYLIAGLGSIGRRHLRNLRALGQSDIILLRSRRSTLPEIELEGLPVEVDLKAALKRHKPDAVIVANPTAMHLDVAIPAARTGCAILLEKPISNSGGRLRLLENLIQRHGSPVLMGFQLRYHPCLTRARDLIQSGKLGRIMSAGVQFGEHLPSWHPWEDYRIAYAARADLGGGALATQCHSIDYLPWLLGEVDSVWGRLAKLSDLEIDVEDTAEIMLTFETGALGSLHIDFIQQPPTHGLRISGTAGSLIVDLLGGELRHYDVLTQAWESSGPPAAWERNTMFVDEMSHFIEVVQGRVRPACTLEDGMRVMKIMEAARKSNRTGRTVSLSA